MERTDTKQAVKVVLLGNSGAGKSSLAQRFVFNTFNHYSESTIGASFFTKHMLIQNGQQELRISDEKSSDQEEEEEAQQSIKFHVWDTAGQEKYHSLAPMYYRGARAAVVVYDICNGPSFEALKSWLQRLKEFGPKGLIIMIVGNKCDLADGRQVDREQAESFAKSEDCLYLECSAREDVNVELIFQEIARLLPSGKDEGPINDYFRLQGPESIRTRFCGC